MNPTHRPAHALNWASHRRLFAIAAAALPLAVTPAQAQINSQLFAFTPVGAVNLNGPGGEAALVNTQISFGNFAGNLEWLYQYQLTVLPGSPVINGFNLWTSAGGLGAGPSILAATGQPPGGGAGAAANLWAASAPDLANPLQRAAPGGVTIPPTPVAAPVFTPAFNALVAAVSFNGAAGGFFFNVPNGNLNQNFQFNSPGWDFTAWAGGGNTLARWFSAGGIGPGQKSPVLSILSPFAPVRAGGFPDPPDVTAVNMSIDDSAGDVASGFNTDQLAAVPEPSTWGVVTTAGLAGWAAIRRRRKS
jgi:PEP-CTERM motif